MSEIINHQYDRSPLAPLAALDKLVAQSENYDQNKHDYEGVAQSFKFTDEGLIRQMGFQFGSVNGMGAKMSLTDHALGQLLARLSPNLFGRGSNKVISKDTMGAMLRTFPRAFAHSMNDILEADNGRNLMVRGYGETARAVLSGSYAKVNTTELLKQLHGVLAPEAARIDDLRITRSSVTPDDLNLYIVWKDVQNDMNKPGDGATLQGDARRGNYGLGCYVGNGEIGNRSLVVKPIIWRSSCTNSIIVDSTFQVHVRHIGDPTALMATVKLSMMNMLPIAAETLNKVMAAELKQLPSFSDVINGLAKQHGWKDQTTDAVKIGTEGKDTLMGLVNGITYAAHTTLTDANETADLEMLAGKILVSPDSLFARAAQLVSVRR